MRRNRPKRKRYWTMVACVCGILFPVMAGAQVDEEAGQVEDLPRVSRTQTDRVRFSDAAVRFREASEKYSQMIHEYLDSELPKALEIRKQFEHDIQALTEEVQNLKLNEFEKELGDIFRDLKRVERDAPEILPRVKEIHVLELEGEALAQQIQGLPAGDKQRDRLEAQLRENLEKAFDLSQEVRQSEAGKVEAELKEMRQLLEKRQENRTAIVDRRLYEMIHERDPYAW